MAIASFLIGVYAVGAFFAGVADDPCESSGAGSVALFVGAILVGIAAYLLVARWTSRQWIPVVTLIASGVGVYLALALVGLWVFWVPNCTN